MSSSDIRVGLRAVVEVVSRRSAVTEHGLFVCYPSTGHASQRTLFNHLKRSQLSMWQVHGLTRCIEGSGSRVVAKNDSFWVNQKERIICGASNGQLEHASQVEQASQRWQDHTYVKCSNLFE